MTFEQTLLLFSALIVLWWLISMATEAVGLLRARRCDRLTPRRPMIYVGATPPRFAPLAAGDQWFNPSTGRTRHWSGNEWIIPPTPRGGRS